MISSSNGCIRTRQMTAHPDQSPGSSLHPKYHSGSSPSPRFSTMASTSSSQRPKGRDGALSTLDVLVQVLTLAKDTCGVPPAQVALGSAAALLTMIRVRPPPLLSKDGVLTQTHLGLHDQRRRLHGSWSILRGCVSSPLPGVEGETVG
jgi:hypothetical protein